MLRRQFDLLGSCFSHRPSRSVWDRRCELERFTPFSVNDTSCSFVYLIFSAPDLFPSATRQSSPSIRPAQFFLLSSTISLRAAPSLRAFSLQTFSFRGHVSLRVRFVALNRCFSHLQLHSVQDPLPRTEPLRTVFLRHFILLRPFGLLQCCFLHLRAAPHGTVVVGLNASHVFVLTTLTSSHSIRLPHFLLLTSITTLLTAPSLWA